MSENIGTDLYRRTMERAGKEGRDRAELMREVWSGTPWMVDAYTGSISDHRYDEIMDWCRDQFGPEAWPIHGEEGLWHSGSATVYGYTWMGFASEEIMEQFIQRWEGD